MNLKTAVTAILLAASTLFAAGQRRVVFIGDSITDGAWGNSGIWNASTVQRNQEDMNHIYGHGYMMIAASHYQALYPNDGWQFWNRGISGNTLDDLEARWQADVLDLNPDVVSILVGTNDVEMALNRGEAIDIAAWERKLKGLAEKVLSRNPDARLVFCTPFVAKAGWRGQSPDYANRKKLIGQLVQSIENVGQSLNAVIVPFDRLVEQTIASTPDLPASYWIWDGIHPTPAMHYRMAQLWIDSAGL